MSRIWLVAAAIAIPARAHANEPSYEVHVGVNHMPDRYGPEASVVGGLRVDPMLVVSLRLVAFHVPQYEERTSSDTSSITASFTGIFVGPTVRLDLSAVPLWFGATGGIAVGRSSIDGQDLSSTEAAAAVEARAGVSFFRVEKQAFTLSMAFREYLVPGGHTWQASATIGYLVN
jgi:hypothetical protein